MGADEKKRRAALDQSIKIGAAASQIGAAAGTQPPKAHSEKITSRSTTSASALSETWVLTSSSHSKTPEGGNQNVYQEGRTVSPSPGAEEQLLTSLRPTGFSDYIGQTRLKENLQLACRAAAKRGEPLDHLLLHGPPGLGKTSLAKVVAKELGVNCKTTSGPVIERPGDLAAILSSLEERDVLFIDEIHRLSRIVEEVLYPAMEDFQIDVMIGQGPSAKSIKIALKPFTLIGATTRTGLLTSPLRDRFGMAFRLGFYEPAELQVIVLRAARILGVSIDEDAAAEIGRRARGTPRLANRVLKRVRDFAQEQADNRISRSVAIEALRRLDIDEVGLDAMDRAILATIIDTFRGGPVGIETLAASLGEEAHTIEDVYEHFLLQEGFIARTKRGREATARAYEHLGKAVPYQSSKQQLSLLGSIAPSASADVPAVNERGGDE